MSALKHKEESFLIRGVVFAVYREMGCGFLEAVYQECMERELTDQQIHYKAHTALPLSYKGERLNQVYRPDFICFEKIIVELKAVKNLDNEHRAQVLNYLKATGYELGLLVNFGHYPMAEIERIVL